MADKIVTLQDKNDNNLYPVAGALHADTVITGSIKDSAVTTPKIANNAVTSDKIDWTTMVTPSAASSAQKHVAKMALNETTMPLQNGHGPARYSSNSVEGLVINGTTYKTSSATDETRIMGFYIASDGADSVSAVVFAELGVITWSNNISLKGKVVFRYRHGIFNSGNDGKNWITLN